MLNTKFESQKEGTIFRNNKTKKNMKIYYKKVDLYYDYLI